MALSDQIATDFANAMLNTDEFAAAITYHVDGGGDLSRDAVVDEQPRMEDRDAHGRRVDVRTATLFVAADDTNGVASPALEDEVTISGEKWSIVSFSPHGGAWEMTIQRTELLERGPSGYRLER